MAQFARPDSEITVNSWSPSTGTLIYPPIDEVTADNADYIESANNQSVIAEVGLSDVTDPESSTGHIFRYTYAKGASGGNARDIQVALYESTTQIAAGTNHTDISDVWATGSYTLNGTETDNITDYTDLRLRFIAGGSTSPPPGNRRTIRIGWAELETPDAPAAETYSAEADVTISTITVSADAKFSETYSADSDVSIGSITASGEATFYEPFSANADVSIGNVTVSSEAIFLDIPAATVYYPLDTVTNDQVLDFGISGYDYTGTLLSGAVYDSNGYRNGCVRFGGGADHIDVGSWDIDTGEISLAAWFKADDFDVADGRIISKAEGPNEGDHYWMISTIEDTGKKLRFRVKASPGWTDTLIGTHDALTSGVWYHVAATFDGVDMRLYLDGAPAGNQQHSNTGVLDTDPSVSIHIGNNPPAGDRGFDGLIDEVRIYDYVLSETEIAKLGELTLSASADVTISNVTASADATFDSSGETYSASADVTIGNVTASADATFTEPVYSANADVTISNVTVSADATFTEPVYSANADVTIGSVTASADATFTEPVYSANADVTIGSVTASADATFTEPVYSANADVTIGNVTASADADFTAPTYSASADVTIGSVTVSADATFTAPTYSANADVTIGSVTVSADATFTAPTYSANADVAIGNVTVSGGALFAEEVYSANADVTINSATASADATFTEPVYSANADVTISNATISADATFIAPTYSANADVTIGNATVSANATFTEPVYSANADVTISNVTASADADFTAPTYSASADVTIGSVTVSGGALFAEEVYSANADVTINSATASADATFTAPTYSASADVTIGNVTASADATFTAPTYYASADVTIGSVTVSGGALFAEEVYSANADVTIGNVTVSASATFTEPVYSANADITISNVTVDADVTFTAPTYNANVGVVIGASTHDSILDDAIFHYLLNETTGTTALNSVTGGTYYRGYWTSFADNEYLLAASGLTLKDAPDREDTFRIEAKYIDNGQATDQNYWTIGGVQPYSAGFGNGASADFNIAVRDDSQLSYVSTPFQLDDGEVIDISVWINASDEIITYTDNLGGNRTGIDNQSGDRGIDDTYSVSSVFWIGNYSSQVLPVDTSHLYRLRHYQGSGTILLHDWDFSVSSGQDQAGTNHLSLVGASTATYFAPSGGDNNGSLSGTTFDTIATSKLSKNIKSTSAIDLDGTNDFISFNDTVSLTGACTISFWMNADAVSSYIFGGENGDTGNYIQYVDTSTLQLAINDFALNLNTTINTGVAYHVAVTRDTSSGVSLYLNGVFEDSGSMNSDTWSLKTLGSYHDGTSTFDGRLDDTAIFDRQLSDSEINTLSVGWDRFAVNVDATFTTPVYSANADLTISNVAVSADATFTAPVYSASADVTIGSVTVSGGALFAEEVYSANADVTINSATASADASFTAPTYYASADVTIGNVTASADATFTAPTYYASADVTIGSVTASADASFTAPTYYASADVTISSVTASADASFTAPTYSASADVTIGSVTVSGGALFAEDVYSANADVTISSVTASADASFTAPTYYASSDVTIGSVTVSGGALFAEDIYNANADVTIGNVTASADATFVESTIYSADAGVTIGNIIATGLVQATTGILYNAVANLTIGDIEVGGGSRFIPEIPTSSLDYVRLYINHIGNDSVSSMIQSNLKIYYDWALLNIGGWSEVNIPTAGAYGGDYSKLRLVNDPNYNLGQVWEAARKDFIWEPNIAYEDTIGNTISPQPVGTPYINNTPTTQPYHVNYPMGQIIFDNAMPTTVDIRLSYSYRFVQIYLENNIPDWRELQFNSHRVDSDQFLESDSGYWSTFAQHRVQLPMIMIRTSRGTSIGWELGSMSTNVIRQIDFYIFTETINDRNNLVDILNLQNDLSIPFINIQEVIDDNEFPLDYRGELVGNKGYEDFINIPQYRWNMCSMSNSSIIDIGQIHPNLYNAVVRTNMSILV
jgi:hypothetical protein